MATHGRAYHPLPAGPYNNLFACRLLCGGSEKDTVELPSVEEIIPLTELSAAEVLPPQLEGLNGWRHSLIIRDLSGVVVFAVDCQTREPLDAFVEAFRSALAAAEPMPPHLLEAYREHDKYSWRSLERARHGIRPAEALPQRQETLKMGTTVELAPQPAPMHREEGTSAGPGAQAPWFERPKTQVHVVAVLGTPVPDGPGASGWESSPAEVGVELLPKGGASSSSADVAPDKPIPV